MAMSVQELFRSVQAYVWDLFVELALIDSEGTSSCHGYFPE